jgi:hypothetical protein
VTVSERRSIGIASEDTPGETGPVYGAPMTDGPADRAFLVATQSVGGGGSSRRPRRPRRIGAALVLLASVALVVVGFLGPRISNPPNFDISYFATPTPRETPSRTPRPTVPTGTPAITPLPVISTPEGAPPLEGQLFLTGNAIQRLDLATGTTTDLVPMTQWQDGVIRLRDDRVACVCIVDGFEDRGATRIVRLVSLDTVTGATVASNLATYATSPDAVPDQPDPLFDVAVDGTAAQALLAVATRTADGWQLSVRNVDPRVGDSGPDVPIGAIPLPALPAPSPTPGASDAPSASQLYLDGPHIRLSPDGRTAFVTAIAQRYADYGDPVFTRGGWRIALGADGSIEDIAPFVDFGEVPVYCPWLAFVGNDRLVTICGDQDPADPSVARWIARLFDLDGRLTRTIVVPHSDEYGYGEPLIDDARGLVFLWDQIGLQVVRLDLSDGSVISTTFDPAASGTGATPAGGGRRPSWHDAESALQQSPFNVLAGSLDGGRLFATGFQARGDSDFYGERSLGVFVIDAGSLALLQHWAPVANDSALTVLSDDRIAVSGQPGMNAAGDEAPWAGSLTIRETADGSVVARYGRVSQDMPPFVLRP